MDSEKVASLQHVPLFSMLEPKDLATLAALVHRQRFRKGQIIFSQGDAGNAMYVLLKGAVRMTLPSESGPEVIVALLRPGDHFGELAVLDGGSRYVTAIAVENADVLTIYRDEMVAFLHGHAEASLHVMLSLCARLRHITELLADIAFLDLLPRLAKRLCQLAGIAPGSPVSATRVEISQSGLAEIVGATREAVNKRLATLRQIGVIETERGGVRILRPDTLRAIAFGNVTEFTL
jgi:CRP-like cAMP-binding protein